MPPPARAVLLSAPSDDYHIRVRQSPLQRFTLSRGYANPDVERFRRTSVTTAHLDGVMIDGRHHMQVRVFYEDTDFSGTALSQYESPCASMTSLVVLCEGNRFSPCMAATLA